MSTGRHGHSSSRFRTELWALALAAVLPGPCAGAETHGVHSGIAALPLLISDAKQQQSYYLETLINDQSTGLVLTCLRRDDDWLVPKKQLQAIELRVDDLAADDGGYVALSTIDGLNFRYDESTQRLYLEVDPERRKLRIVGSLTEPRFGETASGALVNYDVAFQQQQGKGVLRAFSEQRVFGRQGVLSNTGISSAGSGVRSYVRLDTVWTRADASSMRSLSAGDVITRSLAWTRSARIAGIQFSSNFALRPDLVTYPVAGFSGTTAVPSSVDLYVNQVRQFTSNVPAGPFRIEVPPTLNGAGQASVVVTDLLGRNTMQTLDLYVVPQMLKPGLVDYSFATGWLRENYGLRSADYRRGVVTSGSLRSGLTDWLTLEAHGEAAAGLMHLGSGALVRLGRFGRLNASLSLSRADGAGRKFSAGYQYVSERISVTAELQQASKRYRDLPSLLGSVPSRRQLRLFLGSQLGPGKYISAGYLVARGHAVDSSSAAAGVESNPGKLQSHTRLVSVGYRQLLGRRATLSANAFHDIDQPDNRGVYIGLSVAVGRSTHFQTNYSSANERGTVTVARQSPYEGGWGWDVHSSIADQSAIQIGSQFTGSKGVASFDFSAQSGTRRWMLGGRGAITMIRNSPLAGRYVDDAFAIVSTNGVGNVPVTHENRTIGRTNSNGYLMIPNLNAYQENRIGIDPLGVPFNYQLGMPEQETVPRLRAGTLVTFSLENAVAAISVSLVDERGAWLPAGSRGTNTNNGESFVVGYDGVAFIRKRQGTATIQVRTADGVCTALINGATDTPVLCK